MTSSRSADSLSVRGVAEVVLEELGELVTELRLMSTREYTKMLNLTGDVACWEGWEVHARCLSNLNPSERSRNAALRDVGVIALRRKFIPPLMETMQDVVLVYYGRRSDHAETAQFMSVARNIAATVSPTALSPVDRPLVALRANALLLDADAYSWFQGALKLAPRCARWAKAFCKSLLQFMYNAGGDVEAVDAVFPELAAHGIRVTPADDDPLHFATLMERDVEGLPDSAPPAAWFAWVERVWAYLAFAVDGGLLPGTLSIERLVHLHAQLGLAGTADGARAQAKMARIIESLLRVRAPAAPFVYAPLPEMVQDPVLTQHFVFNPRVMERLLDTNLSYVRAVLLAHVNDPLEFPRFLGLIMNSAVLQGGGVAAHHLKAVVCQLIVEESVAAAATPEKREDTAAFMTRITPSLLNLLSDDDVSTRVLALTALANFTNDYASARQALMGSLQACLLVSFLGSPHNELVRLSATILHNVTRTPEYLMQIVSFKGIPLLMRLLEKSDVPPAYRPTSVLAQARASACAREEEPWERGRER
jgi:hypothetical protein